MYKNGLKVQFSPSDLMRYMESPFASWMDRYALEYPQLAPDRDPDDELMQLLQSKGYDHEDSLEAQFKINGKQLVKIDEDNKSEQLSKTIQAMQQGADVIVQARLEIDQFAGYADFLVKVPHQANQVPSKLGDWHYEIWDTKLASKVKPTFLIQLCCYAEMLESLQGVLPHSIKVALGNGDIESFKTNDFYYYYLTLKNKFLQLQSDFDQNTQPDPANSDSWGNWSTYAEQLLNERDHLFQVANITKGHIKKLNKVGVYTLLQLAESDIEYVQGVNPIVIDRLKQQASIQLASRLKAQEYKQNQPLKGFNTKPEFEVLSHVDGHKIGLALLPPHSALDVFFDIEGYPLEEGGLEYLWGNAYFDEQGERQFKDFWAHNCEQEKQCFQDFIQWVYARWIQDPSMHIYHYASYEVTACRKLMGRYGVCEYEVDQLLRNEVFVDLYKVVRGGLRVGEPKYSIKNVELLYRDKRDTEVEFGGDSIVVYENWKTLNLLGEEGDTWQTSKILQDIRDYNIDDCNSTQELVDWLRGQQSAHNIQYLGETEIVDTELSEEASEVINLRDRLLARASVESLDNPDKGKVSENLAWMLEFHRRESKPLFWRLFDRLEADENELINDLDCLAFCERTDREPFKSTPRSKNLSYEYHFDIEQEFKGASNYFYILGLVDDSGKNTKVSFDKEHSDLDKGLIVLKSKDKPPSLVSLIPDEYVGTKPIESGLFRAISKYDQDVLSSNNSAIIDFLQRSKPRIRGHKNGSLVTSNEADVRMKQIIEVIENLDGSYLPIQGPPGAGKTYTAKQAIAHLVKLGAKIGVSSNSHKAINNLILNTAKYCKEHNIKSHIYCNKYINQELQDVDVEQVKNNKIIDIIQPGCVVGTTAWGFSREELEGEFDYLFIDEAGQVATANLVAMSQSAKNLVLLGDQMQLGQPSQGVHPAESGLSILDYLLYEKPTVDADAGIFLDTTYRMHSNINNYISQLVYDSKLKSHPNNDNRKLVAFDHLSDADFIDLEGVQAGIVNIPVQHEGNTQASDEEVDVIKKLALSLLDTEYFSIESDIASGASTQKLSWSDILFVAPYNHQVSKIKAALGPQARVGSVDKFQGQEAPIVILSMCASNANASPRGIDFLLDRNRLNVAISRAQILAVVVASSELATSSVRTVEQLKKLNMFNAAMHFNMSRAVKS